MAQHKVTLTQVEGLTFEAEVTGHRFFIDASPQVGGNDRGPRPKPLLLASLGGCTALDVASLLKKMRVETEKFQVEVQADVTEEHPKHYTHIHVIYRFWGKDLKKDRIERAVQLSIERYCGVHYLLKKAVKITHEIIYNE